MEVNKEQAERCRDLGAEALKRRELGRAVKFLAKSLQLYPLPGVGALLSQAERLQQQQQQQGGHQQQQQQQQENGTDNGPEHPSSRRRAGTTATSDARQSASSSNRGSSSGASANGAAEARSGGGGRAGGEATGADGRTYTAEQVEVVQRVLRSRQGGRGAHYRVLQLQASCNDADIKKAYRKLALRLHPDKNSAPHADEAFKAVGLAYATLSDPQKRHIYDRYGEEDPDNRGGGGGGFRGRGGGMYAQDVNPEEIFNMFFGGGMPGFNGAGSGFHVYTTGFGPGMQFRAARPRGGAGPQQRGQAAEPAAPNFMSVAIQLLPVLLIALVSFLRFNETDVRNVMPGEDKYFSLTYKTPFVNRLSTRLTDVKDIPFFVSDRFLQTYHRNRYQLGQVEAMVERAYEQYLVSECKSQLGYKRKLEAAAQKEATDEARQKAAERAAAFELSRCVELKDLFPKRNRGSGYGANIA